MTTPRALALTLLASAALSAQWINYPTPGVPKTPSGLPNLGAPAPRTADGHPDLSGIWEADNTRPCPPYGCPDMRLSFDFADIGQSIKGLPYTPATAELVKKRMAVNGKDDPASACLPTGVPRMHIFPTLRKYVDTPGLLVILEERNKAMRQIFTDGRPLPVDPQPSWYGYSSGRWDGDTLIVETNGFRDGLWLDRNGDSLTSKAHVTERFRRLNYGNMDIEVTVDDPGAYTKPWTIHIKQFIVLNTDLIEQVCLENERDAGHLTDK